MFKMGGNDRKPWAIKNYWVWMRQDNGYRGVGNMRWWRGDHRWAEGFRIRIQLDEVLKPVATTKKLD